MSLHSAHASVAAVEPDTDPRLEPGAYVTDGTNLYEVAGVRSGAKVMGVAAVRVVLENCRSLSRVEFLPDKIKRSFRLVRGAPQISSDFSQISSDFSQISSDF